MRAREIERGERRERVAESSRLGISKLDSDFYVDIAHGISQLFLERRWNTFGCVEVKRKRDLRGGGRERRFKRQEKHGSLNSGLKRDIMTE